MDAIGERIVATRDVDELLELALERVIALAQHLDLPLDQADRRALVAQVRQAQLRQQRSVALEEIRAALQVLGDRRFVDAGRRNAAGVAGCHGCILPMMVT